MFSWWCGITRRTMMMEFTRARCKLESSTKTFECGHSPALAFTNGDSPSQLILRMVLLAKCSYLGIVMNLTKAEVHKSSLVLITDAFLLRYWYLILGRLVFSPFSGR